MSDQPKRKALTLEAQEIRREMAQGLYENEGWSPARIGEHVGATQTTVSSWAKKYGWKKQKPAAIKSWGEQRSSEATSSGIAAMAARRALVQRLVGNTYEGKKGGGPPSPAEITALTKAHSEFVKTAENLIEPKAGAGAAGDSGRSRQEKTDALRQAIERVKGDELASRRDAKADGQ